MSEEAINRAVRRTRKALPLGPDARCCKCGSAASTSLTLKRYYRKIWCYECLSAHQGKATVERHHLLGKANDPKTTVGVPGNLHRALSDAQEDWPHEVRYNRARDPLLWIAGLLYSLRDIFREMVGLLEGVADFLVGLSRQLRQLVSPTWWIDLHLDLSWMGGAAA